MADFYDFEIEGPGVKAPTSWDRVASILGGMGGGGGSYAGLGASIGSLGGPVGTAIGGAIGGAADIGSKIAGLFGTSKEGMEKIDATKIQQTMENTLSDIQKQVTAGTLPAGQAVKMLQNLIAIASSYGSTTADARGMNTVLQELNQALANVSSHYNRQLSSGVDKSAAGGLGSSFVDPVQQVDWIKQQLRNKMTGFSAGDQNLAGSPMEKLFKPAFDPYAQLPRAMSTAKSAVPDYQEPSAFDRIRKRLGV